MTEPLLTISAFAHAVDLAPSALRYYDETGLLRPAEVDGRTGYRYYTPDLERRAHMIRRMREIGVPVETMRIVLDGPPDRAADILHGVARASAETARRTAAAVADVISSLRAEDTGPDPVVVSVDGPELATALRRISTAADSSPDSPLAVVLLDVKDAQLTVVATERYWLARWSLSLDETYPGEHRIVLPVGEVDGLAGWLSRQGMVTLSAAEAETRVVGEEEDRHVSTAVDRFPAYRLVFEAQPPARGRATVDRTQLLTAIADEASTVVVRAGRDRMTVSPQDAAEGMHLDAITSGDPVTMGFSSALLRSALTALVGSQATLSYAEPDRAVGLTSADQRNFAALLMPSKFAR